MQGIAPAPHTPNVLRIRLYSELAAAALMIMEICWLAAFYAAFGMGALTWGRVLWVMAVIMLGSHYLARWLNFVKISMRPRQIIFIIWLLFALFGSLKLLVIRDREMGLIEMIFHPFLAITSDEGPSLAGFWHLLVASMLAWRGVSLAREPLRLDTALRSFQIGLLALIIYGFMIASFQPARAYLIVYCFLVCAFLSMAFARLAGVSELRGGRTGRFSRHWLLGILVSVVILTAVAVAIGIGIFRPITWMINTLVMIFLGLVSLITLIISYPILLLFNYLGPFLSGLFNNFPEITIFQELQEIIQGLITERTDFLNTLIPPINAARLMGRVAILLAILAAILLALRWRPVLLREPGEENLSDMERKPSRSGLPVFDPRELFKRFASARRMLAAAQIRRIYTELMELADKLGHPRRLAATPIEFLAELVEIFAEQKQELETITYAYLKVRYGELPESADAVTQVEQAWGRFRAYAHRQLIKQRRETQPQSVDKP